MKPYYKDNEIELIFIENKEETRGRYHLYGYFLKNSVGYWYSLTPRYGSIKRIKYAKPIAILEEYLFEMREKYED